MDWPIPCLGGRRQEGGERANSAPEMASPTKLQTGFQFLIKDFLRFWMVDIHWEGRSQKRHKEHPTGAWETEAGTAEGIRCIAPRESALIKLLVASAARTGEGTKLRPNRVCAFVEYPRT